MKTPLLALLALSIFQTASASEAVQCNVPIIENFVPELPPQDSLYDFPLADLKLAAETQNFSDLPQTLVQGERNAAKLSRVFANDIGNRAMAEAFWAVGYRTKQDLQTLLDAIPNMEAAEQKKIASKAVEFLDKIYTQKSPWKMHVRSRKLRASWI